MPMSIPADPSPLPLPIYSASLLSAVGATTTLDFDGNDAQLIQAFDSGTFTDMTSNQAIIAGELTKPHHAHIPREAVKEAQDLIEKEVDGAKSRDAGAVAVDIMGIKLALLVLPSLKDHGLVHAQTSIGAANSLPRTLAHAKSLIDLFSHYGVPKSRVCLKIPSTIAGLQACAQLERDGVNTLATVCYTVEQALAGAAAGCRYVAAYVNPLSVHFVPGSHVEKGFHGLDGYKVLTVAQKTLEERQVKRTQMMAASLVTLPELLSLPGLAHSTISPGLLTLLRATETTSAQETLISQSQSLYESATPAPLSLNCDLETEEGMRVVTEALDREPIRSLMASALEIFGGFEMQLMGLARSELLKVGEGH